MSFIRLTPVAGPSTIRWGRQIHCSNLRWAAKSPSPSPFTIPMTKSHSKLPLSPAPSSTLPKLPNSTSKRQPAPRSSIPITTSVPRIQAAATNWPWKAIPSRRAETEEIERVIFARPMGSRPRMLWFIPIIWCVVLYGAIVIITLPPPRGKAEVEAEVAELVKKTDAVEKKESIPLVIARMALPYCLGLLTVAAFLTPFIPSRIVTRLALVKSRPVGGTQGGEKTFLRLSHGGHQMVTGKRSLARELEMGDVRVNLIGTGEVRSPYLNLTVLIPHGLFSFDSAPYKMNFQGSSRLQHTSEEVVLSLARVEEVFGKLQPRFKAPPPSSDGANGGSPAGKTAAVKPPAMDLLVKSASADPDVKN